MRKFCINKFWHGLTKGSLVRLVMITKQFGKSLKIMRKKSIRAWTQALIKSTEVGIKLQKSTGNAYYTRISQKLDENFVIICHVSLSSCLFAKFHGRLGNRTYLHCVSTFSDFATFKLLKPLYSPLKPQISF